MKSYRIFVINLDRSSQRLEQVKLQLDKLNITFERIEAIDGAKLSNEALFDVYNNNAQDAYYKHLNKGEIACYLSHQAVWRTIVEQKLDFALVFEDDILISKELPACIDTISNLPEDWDYIKLAEHPQKRKALHEERFEQHSRIIYHKVPARTCAQAVSFIGATKLLKGNQRFNKPIDIDLQYWWEKDLRVFGLKPYPVGPDLNNTSDIDLISTRKRASVNRFKKIKNMCRFYFLNRRHNKRNLTNFKDRQKGKKYLN